MIRFFAAVVSDSMYPDNRLDIKKKDRVGLREAGEHLTADSGYIGPPSALIGNR